MTSDDAPRSAGSTGSGASAGLVTVGVEEEYLLLDAATGLPVPRAAAVRDASDLEPALSDDDVHLELLQSQLEVATPVCDSLDEIGGHLLRLRHSLVAAAEREGCRLVASGAAPWVGQSPTPITDERRYHAIRREAQALVDEQLINGMHVHVAVPDRAAGVRALNAVRPWLPVLVAMGASSPMWGGRDTGFASWRTIHFERWPVQGPPPHFADADDYEARIDALLGTGTLLDRGQLYWHARLSERYPTVEIRACDVQLRVDDAVMVAGLVRGLVETALLEPDTATDAFGPVPPELLRAATWQSARHGLDSDLYDVHRRRLARAGDVVLRLLEHVTPSLERRGEARQVTALVERLLRDGNGAQRQRRVLAERGPAAVVPHLAAETASAQLDIA
jgi:carboxylate-amine ligase